MISVLGQLAKPSFNRIEVGRLRHCYAKSVQSPLKALITDQVRAGVIDDHVPTDLGPLEAFNHKLALVSWIFII